MNVKAGVPQGSVFSAVCFTGSVHKLGLWSGVYDDCCLSEPSLVDVWKVYEHLLSPKPVFYINEQGLSQ